ncbi:MAG: hypothetical protein ABJH98_15815 [Reichenbachiella sp.]|uniref:hypothetical protein n=1 Tax=Reichenbachiella sp. TaxID=2184521 RepID=UPI0032997433
MADINVLVTVDTENITPDNLKTTVVLTDNNGDHDTTPGDSETFDIEANAGQTVGFTIAAKNGTDPVSLNDFTYEGDTDGILNPLPATSNGFVGTATGNTGQDELFYVNFKANGTDYSLDPKIEIKPGG